MFLTRGHLHHEQTWSRWFQAAAGLLPHVLVQAQGCEEDALARIGAACAIPGGNATVIQQQRLFSIYIHVGLDNSDFSGEHLPCLAECRCDGRIIRGFLFMLSPELFVRGDNRARPRMAMSAMHCALLDDHHQGCFRHSHCREYLNLNDNAAGRLLLHIVMQLGCLGCQSAVRYATPLSCMPCLIRPSGCAVLCRLS